MKLKALIHAKLFIEAAPFYENLFKDAKEVKVPGKNVLLVKNDIGLYITGSGKTKTAMGLSALFSMKNIDLSESIIISIGCAGGSYEKTVPGDVALITAAVDYDLGNTDDDGNWYHNSTFDDNSAVILNKELCDKAFGIIKDLKPDTTEITKKTIEKTLAGLNIETRLPKVVKGTALSGDNYWKGFKGHEKSVKLAKYYDCPDPYIACEMEDVATAYIAKRFGLLDRLIILRNIVNTDIFLTGSSAKALWDGGMEFSEQVSECNEETLDIFQTAQYNCYRAASEIMRSLV